MRPIANQLQRMYRERTLPPPSLLPAIAALLFAAVLAPPAAAQKRPAPRPNPKAFVGTWKASFKGAPFMTLRFRMKAGKLTGTMSNGQVTVDQDGYISAVTVLPGEKPVDIDKVEHNVIYLHHGSKENPVRFSFRLDDKTHAQLQILNPTPLSIATPKPFLLIKQKQQKKR